MKEGAELGWVQNVLENALTDAELYRKVKNTTAQEAERAIGMFSELKDRAALGERQARDTIVEYFADVIRDRAGKNTGRIISGLVDFDDICDNGDDVIFEMLTDGRSLGGILEKYAAEDVFDGEMLRKAAEKENENGEISAFYSDLEKRLLFVAERMYASVYGQDCIDSMQYQDINEIGMLSKDYIYVIFKGKKIRLPFLKIKDTGVIINIQKKTTQNSAMNFDRQNPILVTAKNNSSRIAVASFDVTPFEKDTYYNERIFSLKVISLEKMRDTYNTIDSLIYGFLCLNQKGRGSFLVTGSDMGVGKSTFLLAMLEKYPDYWGIGVLDPQNELQTAVKYPAKNVITLVENGKKTLEQCFAYLLKTSRDIIVVGEITLPAEVSEMINAAMRLNAGVCATMHSLSPDEVIPNLRNLMLRTQMYNSKETAEDDASGAIDLIIHLRRLKNGRIVVESIHEVCRLYSSAEPYREEETETDSEDELRKKLLRLRIASEKLRLSGKRYELRKLVSYNRDKGKWDVHNIPSDDYFRKMGRYADEAETERIREMFYRGKEETK